MYCYSGMRPTNRKPFFSRAFRPDNNSPFAEHLTPVSLLCLCRIYYITFSYNFNRLIFDELAFCTRPLPFPARIRPDLRGFHCNFSQGIPAFFIKTEISLNSSTNFRAVFPSVRFCCKRVFLAAAVCYNKKES